MAPLNKAQVLEKLEEYNKMPPKGREDIHPFEDVEIGDVNFTGAQFTGRIDFTGAQFN